MTQPQAQPQQQPQAQPQPAPQPAHHSQPQGTQAAPDPQQAASKLGKSVSGFCLTAVAWLFAAAVVVAILWGVLISPLAQGLKDQPDQQAAPKAESKAQEAGRAEEQVRKLRAEDEAARLADERIRREADRRRREHARNAARAEQKAAVRRGEAALEAVEALAGDVAAYEKETSALMKDERGRAVAADPQLVRQFRVVLAKKREGAPKVGELRAGVKDYLDPARASAADRDDAAPPAEKALARFREAAREAEALRGEYKDALVAVEAIVARAQAAGGKGRTTLAEAIRADEREEALVATRAEAAEVEKAQKERGEVIGKVKAEQIRKETLLEKARVEQEIADKEAVAKQEFEQKKADAKFAALRKKARDPAVARHLAPLVAKGHAQPGSGGAFSSKGESKPMSLQALRTSGALEKTDSGQRTMLRIMCDKNSGNDRKVLWGYWYQDTWTTRMREDVVLAQKYLEELGPALVAEGLLSE